MGLQVDFRLADVSLELHALEDHFDLIEKQLAHLVKSEQATLAEYYKKYKLTPEDAEWHLAWQECDQKVEFLLPRFFWGSFIVTLYAVYETGVTEIAKLIQKTKKEEIGINDLRYDFLERAKKYYKSILKFELCTDENTWQRIKMLSTLRHAIAHANGRIDMLNASTKNKIKNWEKQNIGIDSYYDYLVIKSDFAKETLGKVSASLRELVERYKVWDTNTKSKSKSTQ